MAAKFPTAVATDADLLVAMNRAQTTLVGALNSSDTTFTLASDAFAANVAVTIGSEIILILTKSGVTVTNCTRGFDSTSAASHVSGVAVSAYIDAVHHRQVSLEIQAIETALGANLVNIATIPNPLTVNKGGSGVQTITGILEGHGTSALTGNAAASELTYLRRKPNNGATAAYEFAAGPVVVSTDYNFTAQAPGGSLAIGSNTITLAPVPLGINGADLNHKVYISAGTGAAEALTITGGTAVSGAASGTIIVTCANTHTGAWTVSSVMAGIPEALSILGTSPGKVYVPAGTYNAYGPARIQYSFQGIVGAGKATTIFKTTAAGNLIEVQATTGTIYYNFVSGCYLQTLGTTPTAGAMVYVDTSAQLGFVGRLWMDVVWIGLQHFGANWIGGHIVVKGAQTSGSSYAFNLRGGQWTNLQALQPITTPGKGVGIFIDGPCDGLLIVNSFVEGGFVDAIALNAYDALTTGRVIDVNFANVMLDSFVRSGIVMEGAGAISLITFTGGHIQTQLVDASNQPCVWITSAEARHITFVGTRFNYGNKEFILAGAAAQSDLLISGNLFNSGSFGSAGANANVSSAVVITTPTRALVTGNIFSAFGASAVTHKYDLELNGNVTKSNISCNSFYGNLTGPVLKPTTMATTVFAHNAGIDNVIPAVASAASLAFPLNPVFTLTGTTIVTAVTDLWEGRVGRFICTGGPLYFVAGASIGNTVAITPNVPYTYCLQGSKIWISPAGAIVSVAAAANSTSSLGSTVLLTAPTPGVYRVAWALNTGSVSGGSGTALVTIGWTDAVGAKTSAGAALTLAAAANQSGSVLVNVASGNLTYTTTYVAGSGGNYNLQLTAELVK